MRRKVKQEKKSEADFLKYIFGGRTTLSKIKRLCQYLPKKYHDILYQAYYLEQRCDYLLYLVYRYGSVNTLLLSRILDFFYRLVDSIYRTMQNEDIKTEVGILLRDIIKSASENISTQACVYILTRIKYFLYIFVYGPFEEIASNIEKFVEDSYADITKKRFGTLPYLSEGKK